MPVHGLQRGYQGQTPDFCHVTKSQLEDEVMFVFRLASGPADPKYLRAILEGELSVSGI